MERKRVETKFTYIDQYCRETGLGRKDQDALNYLHMDHHGLQVFKALTGDAAQRLEDPAYLNRMRRMYEDHISPIINRNL